MYFFIACSTFKTLFLFNLKNNLKNNTRTWWRPDLLFFSVELPSFCGGGVAWRGWRAWGGVGCGKGGVGANAQKSYPGSKLEICNINNNKPSWLRFDCVLATVTFWNRSSSKRHMPVCRLEPHFAETSSRQLTYIHLRRRFSFPLQEKKKV